MDIVHGVLGQFDLSRPHGHRTWAVSHTGPGPIHLHFSISADMFSCVVLCLSHEPVNPSGTQSQVGDKGNGTTNHAWNALPFCPPPRSAGQEGAPKFSSPLIALLGISNSKQLNTKGSLRDYSCRQGP